VIGKLRGKIDEVSDDCIVVDVDGVGYMVRVTAQELDRATAGSTDIVFHIHTHVREDAIELYGFRNRQQLRVFKLLIGVSGVGPRLALDTLSTLEPADFMSAISSGDLASLTQISGVGKKTAERLVLELSDKVGTIDFTPRHGTGTSGAGTTATEAVEALGSLGYSRSEAEKVVRRLLSEDGQMDTQEIVRRALQHLSGEGGVS